MALYESVVIARQDIPATQVVTLVEEFSEVIAKNGGKVVSTENWGLRNLAYRVKKNRKGHYVLLNIDAPAEAVHEFERLMRINEDILRYMTLRLEKFSEEPSVMVSEKDSTEA